MLLKIGTEHKGVDSLLYTCTDNQGSLIALTNESGKLLERYAYDPWGQRRNPDQWELKDGQAQWILNRGYTGHEHLDAFGIINMNGRIYDPLTAQFFSPDPQLQNPKNWLNYNRYGYCFENPLKYTDPSGEYFVLDDWIIGGISGLFNSKGFWKGANEQAWNAIKMYAGLFVTDPNRDIWGRAWQLISKFTWELPQTVVGLDYSLTRNEFGAVDRVDYFGGATYSTTENSKNVVTGDGITFGSFINIRIPDKIPDNVKFDDYVIKHPLYMHEYGHTLDSQYYGLSYLFLVGAPSGISAWTVDKAGINKWNGKYVENPNFLTTHDVRSYEMRANKRASDYFKKYYNVTWDENDFPTTNPFE